MTWEERTAAIFGKILQQLKPLPPMSVSDWAETHRVMSSSTTATPGRWSTDRTPYLRDIMNAFTDKGVHRISVVAPAQVGKSEMLLNMIGYAIDRDPGSMMFGLPNDDVAEDFSKRRLSDLIRNTPPLKAKVYESKGRDSSNTITKKVFPGGMLSLVGSNSPAALASTPTRYVFGDERDRWAASAGTEGDPWKLLEARTITFHNYIMVEVSTPTIKGRSAIERGFRSGTMEYWNFCCPHCGEFNPIWMRKNIRFDIETYSVDGKTYKRPLNIVYVCPDCGACSTEKEMRKTDAKWIATNPEANEKGHRSFWITPFSSPWVAWESIVQKFLDAEDNKLQLQTVINTVLGELWEDRSIAIDEETLLNRLEPYPAELPEGVLVLTCGVDTQDDRLEYEIVGFGRNNQSWGIYYGTILGDPVDNAVWEQLDKILEKEYMLGNGKTIRISNTFIDTGGHRTDEVYEYARTRQLKQVFAIKGAERPNIAYVGRAKKHIIKDDPKAKMKRWCWLFEIGVNQGKSEIMMRLQVESPDMPGFCHFPTERGYDMAYFSSLLAEQYVFDRKTNRMKWQKFRARNEALDCRNYALAAFKALMVDFDALERQLMIESRAKSIKKGIKKRSYEAQKGVEDEW